MLRIRENSAARTPPVSYTHLRAHETVLDLVCRLLLETKNQLQAITVYEYVYSQTSLHVIMSISHHMTEERN